MTLEELCKVADQKSREADEAALAVVQKRREEIDALDKTTSSVPAIERLTADS